MQLGGRNRSFQMYDSPHEKVLGQVMIETKVGDYRGDSGNHLPEEKNASTALKLAPYEKVTRVLDSTEGVSFAAGVNREHAESLMRQQRAELILESIVKRPSEQRVWEEQYLREEQHSSDARPGYILSSSGQKIPLLDPLQVHAAVGLITVTQIAEAAPPSREYAHHYHMDPKDKMSIRYLLRKIDGRSPGTDKWARCILRNIQAGTLNFNDFLTKYLPAPKKGTQKTRDFLDGKNGEVSGLEVDRYLSASSGDES